jgi:hypothetical protein
VPYIINTIRHRHQLLLPSSFETNVFLNAQPTHSHSISICYTVCHPLCKVKFYSLLLFLAFLSICLIDSLYNPVCRVKLLLTRHTKLNSFLAVLNLPAQYFCQTSILIRLTLLTVVWVNYDWLKNLKITRNGVQVDTRLSR